MPAVTGPVSSWEISPAPPPPPPPPQILRPLPFVLSSDLNTMYPLASFCLDTRRLGCDSVYVFAAFE